MHAESRADLWRNRDHRTPAELDPQLRSLGPRPFRFHSSPGMALRDLASTAAERLSDLLARNGVQWNGVKRAAEVWRNYVPG